jgi:hypothetical protein
VAGQPIGLNHVLEDIAAEQCLWAKRLQAPDIRRIGQVRFDIDPWQLSHIDVYDLDVPAAQGQKELILDPGLHTFAHFGRTASEVEQRRESLRREYIERVAEPAGFGLEHCVDAFPPTRTTMPQYRIVAKERCALPTGGCCTQGKQPHQHLAEKRAHCSARPGKEPYLRYRIKIAGHRRPRIVTKDRSHAELPATSG